MRKATAPIVVLTLAVLASPGWAKVGFDSDSTDYLGNSQNEAEDGQGGEGTRTETTTGPHGQIKQGNTDCNPCETTTTDKPGRN